MKKLEQWQLDAIKKIGTTTGECPSDFGLEDASECTGGCGACYLKALGFEEEEAE
jgi:DNA repair photolyase